MKIILKTDHRARERGREICHIDNKIYNLPKGLIKKLRELKEVEIMNKSTGNV